MSWKNAFLAAASTDSASYAVTSSGVYSYG
jgi:hypothetical protein